MSTTSASFKAVLRALAVLAECESATTPLPIGVGRNGRFVRSMSSLITCSALAYAAPLPMITKGAFADFNNCAILNSFASSTPPLGASGIGAASAMSSASSTAPLMRSAGRSTKPVPGRPYQDVLYVFCITSGIDSRVGGRRASFVWGVRREMASSSWNAPRETRWVSEEPARRRRGNALTFALPI